MQLLFMPTSILACDFTGVFIEVNSVIIVCHIVFIKSLMNYSFNLLSFSLAWVMANTVALLTLLLLFVILSLLPLNEPFS